MPFESDPKRVKLRAVHLLRRLETIDRDLQELETLQDRIRDDRAYADRLRSSLVDEALRLRQLKTRILAQVIRNPPAALAERAGKAEESPATATTAEVSFRSPEIILPGGAAPSAEPGASPVEPVRVAQAGRAGPRAGRSTARDRKRATAAATDEAESFEFRYE